MEKHANYNYWALDIVVIFFGQVNEFERNGADLTSSKRKEMENLTSQIEKLSLEYIQNLNNDNNFLFFSEAELAGMPSEFIKVNSLRNPCIFETELRTSSLVTS